MPRVVETRTCITEFHAVIAGRAIHLLQTQLQVTAEDVDMHRVGLDLTLEREVDVGGRVIPVELVQVPLRILAVQIVGVVIGADCILGILAGG